MFVDDSHYRVLWMPAETRNLNRHRQHVRLGNYCCFDLLMLPRWTGRFVITRESAKIQEVHPEGRSVFSFKQRWCRVSVPKRGNRSAIGVFSKCQSRRRIQSGIPHALSAMWRLPDKALFSIVEVTQATIASRDVIGSRSFCVASRQMSVLSHELIIVVKPWFQEVAYHSFWVAAKILSPFFKPRYLVA